MWKYKKHKICDTNKNDNQIAVIAIKSIFQKKRRKLAGFLFPLSLFHINNNYYAFSHNFEEQFDPN